jgi:hypothetical protein
VIALQRAFLSEWSSGKLLLDNAALLGLLLGATLPVVLLSAVRGLKNAAAASVLLWALLLCLLTMAVLLYGKHCGVALAFGLLIAGLIASEPFAGLLAMVTLLCVSRLFVVVLPLTDLSRYDRLQSVVYVLLGLIVAIILSAVLERKTKEVTE